MKSGQGQLPIAGILALVVLSFTPNLVFAANVVINEIAWMGTESSYNDEWIELYNNAGTAIDLSGWRLEAADGTPQIQLAGTVSAYGFYLLERTDDGTVPDFAADLIYKGAMGNTGEDLRIYDSSGAIIDAVEALAGWFAGDNASKQTMERKDPALSGSSPNNWQTSRDVGGTPKAENSFGAQAQPQAPAVAPAPQDDQSAINQVPPVPSEAAPAPPSTGKSYPDGILFNELLPSPDGSDAEEEWVEIFNQNAFAVDLSKWQMMDTEGSVKTYAFPAETTIAANGFLLLPRPATGITLNSGGDGLQLKKPDGAPADKVSFSSAPKGQSYSRGPDDWEWSGTPTPGNKNILAAAEARSAAEDTAGSQDIGSPDPQQKSLAQIPTLGLGSGKLIVFLAALALAFFAGIIMVFFKTKLKG